MSDRRKRIFIQILIIGIVISSLILVLPFLVSGKLETVPVSYYFEQNVPGLKPHHVDNAFSVMTLNLGHGRGSSLHQLFQSKKKIKKNAEMIAEVIKREHIDITALQEVDGPGFWNSGFDFIEYLAEKSGCPHGIWTRNVDTPGLSYGTALLSDLAYSHAESYTFKARPFILPKGFTAGIFRISEENNTHVCVVSVHLEPLLAPMRRLQTKAMIKTIENIGYPLVITGDFNCGYNNNSAVGILEKKLDLEVWEPESRILGTHNTGNRRLDWILISKNLEFVEYSVLGDKLSDHSAVRAVIRYRKNNNDRHLTGS